ncbi:TIGR00266 family protein [Streptomyces sp. VRA16 Mangrove soil]|uniref:TIGR00266 family protein n=1 Tax=Streptomyces sp. VRA16 Mangrove soil TaxID=2817434 RepID=UPI001A9DD553|nr:TIGR00266 family protein [Streptomyces sp. VRA16 Mangrove soil]MBO1332856.1 TIGR00266 family protein [Streptomyces sp. VRA16 Mangrove soil]
MDIDVRHNPSFAVARVHLAPGESVRAESGAMMATSGGIAVEAKADGGLMRGLKRSVLGGESLFVTRFTAGSESGWVDVAAQLPGDVTAVDVDGGLNLARGAWLCSSDGVDLQTKWGGFKNLAGGEGGFLVRAEGRGQVLAACYGALDEVELKAGEQLVLDSGHLVAFDDGVSYTTRKVTRGLMQTLKSGEGLVFDFTGPGRLWTQSRNPGALVTWLTQKLPFSRG